MPAARCWPIRAKARCAPEGGLPMLVVGRQILVSVAAVGPELLVFGWPGGAVQRFSIQRRCRRDHTAFDQRTQPTRDLPVAHSRRGAGIDGVARARQVVAGDRPARILPQLIDVFRNGTLSSCNDDHGGGGHALTITRPPTDSDIA